VGEQQLVEIAKALSLSARVLIMDEPTSALSQAECQRLFKIIRQLAAQGTAIIYISHRIDEVMELAHRITVLRDGQNVLTSAIADMDVNRIVAAMVGRELLEMPEEATRNVGDVVLSVRNLTLARRHVRGWRQVLSNVSFDVRRGEIFGIAGLLGSGRTEILETIFGCADGNGSGDIALDGRAEKIHSPLDALRLGIGLVTEDRKSKGLQLSASVTDNVALPSIGRLSRFGRRSFAGERALANRAVKSLGIRCSGIEQLTMNLSGGNQQKVVIGKWLATKPRLLLLDEPTRGIDVGAKREIYELIFHLAREQHLAVVAVSSELPELLLLADRILVMSEGVQTGIVTRAEASEEAIMKLAAPRSRTRAA
jgi:ribose transport system ATP-binding protein